MNPPKEQIITSWNLHESAKMYVVTPNDLEQLNDYIDFAKKNNLKIVIKGGGNSFSDVGLYEKQLLLDTKNLNSIKDFDPTNGIIQVESGVKIGKLLSKILPENWNVGGLSGSLTHLTDGSSYIRAGNNITVTSGSAGSITIASTGRMARAKDSYFLSSIVNAGDAVNVASSDFSAASYDPDKIDIFINGMLMHSGSVSQVEAGDRDYYVSSSTSLKFSFQLHIDDAIDVIVFSVS